MLHAVFRSDQSLPSYAATLEVSPLWAMHCLGYTLFWKCEKASARVRPAFGTQTSLLVVLLRDGLQAVLLGPDCPGKHTFWCKRAVLAARHKLHCALHLKVHAAQAFQRSSLQQLSSSKQTTLCFLTPRMMVQQQASYMNLLIQKVGSGMSRAAANRNNPLHWISGGHTHVYPRCDDDESAPVTPSAGVAASSDAGIVSVASSIDDSALKGTPRSPGHVTHSKLP